MGDVARPRLYLLPLYYLLPWHGLDWIGVLCDDDGVDTYDLHLRGVAARARETSIAFAAGGP